MIMITGGAFQGKERFALDKLGISPCSILDGVVCRTDDCAGAVCIKNYQELVRRLREDGTEPLSFTERLCSINKDAVIIMDEVGCGIVPMEKSERLWRVDCGRCGTRIAASSKTVYRICCGIAQVIKHG